MVKFQKADIVRRAVILFYFFSEGGLKFKGLKEIVTSGPVDCELPGKSTLKSF